MVLSLQNSLISAAVLLILAALTKAWTRNRGYKMPPRVRGPPVLGNTLQMPTEVVGQGPWAKQLAEEYGEMFTLRLGYQDLVFLNSTRVVRDLMDKRAIKYSSRQSMPMVQDTMSGGHRIVLMPYNERWRQTRKIMHGILNSKQMSQFSTYQDVESKQLLWDYLHEPDLWYRSNQRYTSSVIMSVVFGRRLLLNDANLQPLLKQATEMVEALQPGASIADGFPVFQRLPKPLQWWRSRGTRLYEESKRVYGLEVDTLMAKISAGKAPQCFASDFIEATKKTDMEEDQKLFVLGTLLEAGSDTSRMTMSQIVAAAVLFPDWVQTAREHLDRVCGAANRLPSYEDKPQLEYITAAVKESLRWRPFAPIGVPHMLTEDDEYEGYKFPAGTLFTWNSLYISQNEKEYPQATRFWPERFLNKDLNNVIQGHWAFGPGRRVCVGYNVAETNIWMALARLVYCFDFEAVPGKPIDPNAINWAEFENAPFVVKITVRSQSHQDLILRECSG